MAKADYSSRGHFRLFAKSLERVIAGYDNETGKDAKTEEQRRQVNLLFKLEKQFRKSLAAHPWGPACYKAFIDFIVDDKRNILAARPYFRERQAHFAKKISPAIKERDHDKLTKFNINYPFIAFVLAKKDWNSKAGAKIYALAQEIKSVRQGLIDLNIPLAINRAKLFWSRTPKSHLSYMDLIQIGSEGLINAIDKYVPPYTTVFRAVAIGRMTGNFIEEYSSPMLHFYPSDKKIIYRANKAARSIEKEDYEKLTAEVNKGLDKDIAGSSDVHLLMTAASHFSSDSQPCSSEEGSDGVEYTNLGVLNSASIPEEDHPDNKFETSECTEKMFRYIHRLSLIERKILIMRGLDLHE